MYSSLKPKRFARRSSRGSARRLARPALLGLDDLAQLLQEPRAMRVSGEDVLHGHPPPVGLQDEVVALGRGDGERLAQGLRRRPAGPHGTSSSRERIDFWKASLKVRPMAMFSPTLFMCVVSSRRPAGTSRRPSAAS